MNLQEKKHEHYERPPIEEKPYDLMMGYFIVMGGFVMKCSVNDNLGRLELGTKGKIDGTLEPHHVEYLAQKGKFLPVPRTTIQDKSKADILAKCLVCSQVLWMVVEVSVKLPYMENVFLHSN
jgi:hypothetical protein